jgi:cell division protein FtsL
MFGSSKPVVLESYGSRRKRGRPPRWLVLLLVGIVIGACGVVVVQERYLPPRLSAADSKQLRSDYETADAERTRLQNELAETGRQLSAALNDKKNLGDELAASRGTVERLNGDLGALVASLPPDPRGGAVEVRAGQFDVKNGELNYEVVLTRDRAAKPMAGVLQLTVAGTPAKGPETAVTLKPISLSIGAHEVVRGSQALPVGFKAREATIQILSGGKPLGRRVMLVH